MNKKTVCVDFDGVISQYNGYKGEGVFGPPITGAKEAMINLRAEGWTVIVFTTRGEVDKIKEFLDEHSIYYDYINENPDGFTGNVNEGKPHATVYIDDRALTFKGDWKESVKQIKSFKTYTGRK